MSRAFMGIGKFPAVAAAVIVLVVLSACASGVKRVDCNGRLQPINEPTATPAAEGQPP